MPENAVYVGRPTSFGNPFRVGSVLLGTQYGRDAEGKPFHVVDAFHAVQLFRSWTKWSPIELKFLRGKNLACWCPLNQPCHADVLLELANKQKR